MENGGRFGIVNKFTPFLRQVIGEKNQVTRICYQSSAQDYAGGLPSPLVYLLDMEVLPEPAADGRTLTVTVLENDADVHGEKPPVADAQVRVTGGRGTVLAQAKTDAFGVAGLPLPVDADPAKLVVSVHSDRFNPRHLRLDGSNMVEDLRERLYGRTGERKQKARK